MTKLSGGLCGVGIGLFLGLLFLMGGRGSGRGEVTGRVTYNGSPVVFGTVTVIGSDGVPHSAAIDADGSYALKNVPAGAAKVAVASPDPVLIQEQIKQATRTAKPSWTPPSATVNPEHWFPLPQKLQDPEQSCLTLTVQRGVNDHDIDLVGEPMLGTALGMHSGGRYVVNPRGQR